MGLGLYSNSSKLCFDVYQSLLLFLVAGLHSVKNHLLVVRAVSKILIDVAKVAVQTFSNGI